jgi:hypothetical protein
MAPLLKALCLKLLVIEDEDAVAALQIEPANELYQRFNNSNRHRIDMTATTTAAAAASNDAPRYRATEDHTNLGMGFYNRGAEFNHEGWPKVFSGNIEAANESATRIFHYWTKHRLSPGFPASPYSSEHGRIFLPHHLMRDYRSTRQPALPRVEMEWMPRYRATYNQNFGGREVSIDDEVAFCGWPVSGLVPINAAAELVVAYYKAYREHPQIATAPWCDFAQDLFLPDLPENKGRRTAPDMPIVRDDWHDDIMRGLHAKAVATLNAPQPAPRARGNRRRVSA